MIFSPRKYILTIILFFVICSANAQLIKTSDYNTWNGGLRFGVMKYYGDVRQYQYSPEEKYKRTNTTFAFEVGKSLNHVFGLRANALFGGLSGSNPNMNLYFTNSFKELDLQASVNLNNLIAFYPRRAKVVNAYIYIGGGAIFYNTLLKSFDEDTYVNGWGYDSLGAKTNAKMTFTMPFGVGLRIKADEKIDVGIETQLHLVNSDNLDAYTGKSLYNDRFGYTSVSLIYKFGNKKEYVEWVKPDIESYDYYANNVKSVKIDSVRKSLSTTVTEVQTTKPKTDSSKIVAQDVRVNVTKTPTVTEVKTTKPKADSSKVVAHTVNANVKKQPEVAEVKTTKPTVDSSKVIKHKTKTAETKAPVVTEVERNYYIIAGTYKTKKLAKEAVQKYQGKGYPESKFLGVTSSGNIRVSVKSYETAEDAAKEYATVKKAIPTAKLLKKKNEKEYTDMTSKVNSILQNMSNAKTVAVTDVGTSITKVDTAKKVTVNTNAIKKDTAKTVVAKKVASTNANVVNNKTTVSGSQLPTTTVTKLPTTTTTVVDTKRFFIISGSFPTEAAAQSGVAALKSKGFKDAVVVGKNDAGSIRIAYKAYSSREEANKDLTVIKTSLNPSAWIFEKKSTEVTPKVSNTQPTETNIKTTTVSKPQVQTATKKSEVTQTSTTGISTTSTKIVAPTTTTVEKRFFIISGSFPTEAAAQAGVAALKAKGFKDAVVVGKNDAGNIRIAYKAYTTREEANKDLPLIRSSSSNPSAWIFEKK